MNFEEFLKTLPDVEAQPYVDELTYSANVARLLEVCITAPTDEERMQAANELGEHLSMGYNTNLLRTSGSFRSYSRSSPYSHDFWFPYFGKSYYKKHGVGYIYEFYSKYAIPSDDINTTITNIFYPFLGVISVCVNTHNPQLLGIIASHNIEMITHTQVVLDITNINFESVGYSSDYMQREFFADVIGEIISHGGVDTMLNALRKSIRYHTSLTNEMFDRITSMIIRKHTLDIYPDTLLRGIVDIICQNIPDEAAVIKMAEDVNSDETRSSEKYEETLLIVKEMCDALSRKFYAGDMSIREFQRPVIKSIQFFNDFVKYVLYEDRTNKRLVSAQVVERAYYLLRAIAYSMPSNDEMRQFVKHYMSQEERENYYHELGTMCKNVIWIEYSSMILTPSRVSDEGRGHGSYFGQLGAIYSNLMKTKDPDVERIFKTITMGKFENHNVLEVLYGIIIGWEYNKKLKKCGVVDFIPPRILFGGELLSAVDISKIYPQLMFFDVPDYLEGMENPTVLDCIVSWTCSDVASGLLGWMDSPTSYVNDSERALIRLSDYNWFGEPCRIYTYNANPRAEPVSVTDIPEEMPERIPVWFSLWTSLTCFDRIANPSWPLLLEDEPFGNLESGRDEENSAVGIKAAFIISVMEYVWKDCADALISGEFDKYTRYLQTVLQIINADSGMKVDIPNTDAVIEWLIRDPWCLFYANEFDTTSNDMLLHIQEFVQGSEIRRKEAEERLSIEKLIPHFNDWGEGDEYPTLPYECAAEPDEYNAFVYGFATWYGFEFDEATRINARSVPFLEAVEERMYENGHMGRDEEDDDWDNDENAYGDAYGGKVAENALKTHRNIRDGECGEFSPGTMGFRKCVDTVCVNDVYSSDRLDNIKSNFEYPYSPAGDVFEIAGVYEITYHPTMSDPVIMTEKNAQRFDAGISDFIRALRAISVDGKSGYRLAYIYRTYSDSNVKRIELGENEDIIVSAYNETATKMSPSIKSRLYSVDALSIKFVVERYNNKKKETETLIYTLRDFVKAKGVLKQLPQNVRMWYDGVLTTLPAGGEVEEKYEYVVSTRPADFERASACQPWMSCHNPHGINNRCPEEYSGQAGKNYMTYLVRKELDPEWLGRAYFLYATSNGVDTLSMQRIYTAGNNQKYADIISDAGFMILHTMGILPENPQPLDSGYTRATSFLTNCDIQQRDVQWHNFNKEREKKILVSRGEGFIQYLRPLADDAN
jgi:hypothetical protein